jgi:hypothetical protein
MKDKPIKIKFPDITTMHSFITKNGIEKRITSVESEMNRKGKVIGYILSYIP